MLVLGGSISQKVESVEFICSKRGTKIKIKEIFFFFLREKIKKIDLRTLDKTFIFI